jgi:hypothetical protein
LTALWVKTLPWRWARNSAIIGALLCFLPLLGTPTHMEQIIRNGGLFWMSLGAAFVALPLALIVFVVGLFVRRTLWCTLDRGSVSVAESIPLKWTLGAVLSTLLITLASDVVIDWETILFGSVSPVNAVARNLALVVSVAGSSALLGLATGLVSRRGLTRAISSDAAASQKF